MKTGIYMIKCKIDKRIYIGHSKDIPKRMREHFNALRRGDHDNSYLQNAFKKYGEKEFEFEVIESCVAEKIIEREYFWIDVYDSTNRDKGFNIIYDITLENDIKKTRNNHGLLSYYKTNEGLERRNKQKERSKIIWEDLEYRERMTELMKKNWEDPEYREKQSKDSKDRWEDSKYRDKYKNSWNDPQWKKETLKKQKEGRDKNTNYIEEVKKREKIKWQDPEFKKKMCKIAKEKWQDPIYREKTLRKQKEAKSKLENNGFTDAARNKISETSKRNWQDPVFKEMIMRKQKEGKEKKKRERELA